MSPLALILAVLLNIGCMSKTTEPATLTVAASSQTSISATTLKPATATSSSVIFPPGTDLAFVTIIGGRTVGGPYLDSTTQIRVLTDSQSASAITGMVYSDDGDTLLAMNYRQYVAIVVFNGFRDGIGSNLEILKIRQSGNTVHIVAHFDDGGGQYSEAITSSQYQAVEIERNSFIRTGEITFQLLDESGKERATTTVNITGN